jgi:hypothetical protein
MASLARRAVGLSAADRTRAAFADLLAGPGESDAMRAAMLTMSTCGLTVRGLLRELGLKDPRLFAPYEPASVMTTLRDMATEAGAWTDGLAPDLAVGDVLMVSEPDHVGTVVELTRRDDGSLAITTVDGGATDGQGNQAIVTFARTIAADGTVTGGPLAGNGRRVIGCINVDALAGDFGGGIGATPLVLGAVGALAVLWALWRTKRR